MRTLAALPEAAAAALALVIVGEVVRLQSKVDWFDERRTHVDEPSGERVHWLC